MHQDWLDGAFSYDAFDFRFISSRAFMLVNAGNDDGGSILLYTLASGHTAGGPSTQPPPDTGAAVQPALVAQLGLPAVQAPHELDQVLSRSSPVVAHAMPGRPFRTGQHERVHMVELKYSDGTILNMFVPNKSLAAFLPRPQAAADNHQEESVASTIVQPLDWREWGPQNTRVVGFVTPNSYTMRCVGFPCITAPIISSSSCDSSRSLSLGVPTALASLVPDLPRPTAAPLES